MEANWSSWSWSCKRDVAIFTGMVSTEIANVGLNTLFKAATAKGMSSYIFITYSYALGALFLLPSRFFSHRSIYLTAGYTGVKYSSPTLASAISNLVPVFTFILAILFRMEIVSLHEKSSVAKIVGAIVAIGGALVATLYHGPCVIVVSQPSVDYLHQSPPSPPPSSNSKWAIGGGLLALEYALKSTSYIIQADILGKYPSEFTITLIYLATVSTSCGTVCFFTENPSSWIMRSQISFLCIIASGIINPGYCVIQSWAVHHKGPVFVAMFRPLSIVIAIAMDAIFLGNSLYLGSLIGGILISVGFYTLMWGKAKEAKADIISVCTESPTSEKIPLLTNHKK